MMFARLAWGLAALVAACDGGRDYDDDGFVEPEDCDDGDPNTHPGAEEVPYDGRDQDCSGEDLVDRDGDGFQAMEAGGPDCNDSDRRVHPGAREVPYDGVDGDCDHWSDDDFDHDGFEAMGHGGEDCDDTDARVTPLDLDGDGASPCTGDCDEGDPRRYEGAEPVCGNGFDDDCDEVSDCTLVGVVSTPALSDRLTVDAGVAYRFGASAAAIGALDGGTGLDLAVGGGRVDGGGAVWLFELPFEGVVDAGVAKAILSTDREVQLYGPGDVDGDGVDDLAVADLGGGVADAHFRLVTAVPPGASDVADLAVLDLTAGFDADLGRSLARVGDTLAVGAPGIDEVALVGVDARGPLGVEDAAAHLVGRPNQGAGASLAAADTDGDGDAELFVGASGGNFAFPGAVDRLATWPTSGSGEVEALTVGTLDLRTWGQTSTGLDAGDVDDDGRVDLVVAGPFADRSVGAVAVLREPLEGAMDVEDVTTQRLGLGDDTLGWTALARDFDGDGTDDLVVGAPAAWGGLGGPNKPGNVLVWYGPVADSVDHLFTADLFVEGAYTEHRTYTGYALAQVDADGDGGLDLAIGAPNDGAGTVSILPGGLSGLYGL